MIDAGAASKTHVRRSKKAETIGEMGMGVSKTGASALKDSRSRRENSLPTSKNTEPASHTIGRANKNSKRPTRSNRPAID